MVLQGIVSGSVFHSFQILLIVDLILQGLNILDFTLHFVIFKALYWSSPFKKQIFIS
jgi:hypothetical protein